MKFNPTERAILHALKEDGPSTAHELAARTGYAYRSLYRKDSNLKRLRGLGLIHVCEWQRQAGNGGAPVPVFAWGKGKDKPKPNPKTRAEKYKVSEGKTNYIRRSKQGKSVLAILLGARRADKKPKPSKSLILTLLEGKA